MPTLTADGRRLNGKGSSWIVKSRRLALYLRDGFTCSYCGRDLHFASPRDVTLDHLIPQCEGGGHESRNLVTACAGCNFRRQSRPWREFAGDVARAHIRRNVRRVVPVALARAILSGSTPRAEAIAARQNRPR